MLRRIWLVILACFIRALHSLRERATSAVTGLRRSEQRLRAAREFEDLYNSAPCGYHSLAADGTFVRLNATELAWLGYEAADVVGRMKVTDFLDAEGKLDFERQWATLAQTGRIDAAEYNLIGRDGCPRRVSLSAAADRDAAGVFVGSHAAMFDVSERARTLESTRLLAETLERRVEQRTEQLRLLAFELEAAEDRERRQIARDLHDDLGQSLAAARVRLDPLCTDPRPDVRDVANAVAGLVDRADRSTRSLAAEIAPAVLYELGLVPALEWLGEEVGRTYGLKVEVSDDGRAKPLPQEVRSILYRAVRELVINVAKHAHADGANVEVETDGGEIVIRVLDGGIGVDAPKSGPSSPGLGLLAVRERLSFIGGTAEVRAAPGGGTIAILRAPLALAVGAHSAHPVAG